MALFWTIFGQDKQSIIRWTKVRQNEKETAKNGLYKTMEDGDTANRQKKEKIFSERGASKICGHTRRLQAAVVPPSSPFVHPYISFLVHLGVIHF